jgi:hypothetical protein
MYKFVNKFLDLFELLQTLKKKIVGWEQSISKYLMSGNIETMLEVAAASQADLYCKKFRGKENQYIKDE